MRYKLQSTAHAERAWLKNHIRESGGCCGYRAESLAARIEEGAAVLAAFTQKLTEEEWDAPVNEGKEIAPSA